MEKDKSFVFLCLLGALSLPPAIAVNITFNATAPLVSCPTNLKTPTELAGFTGGKLLISPTVNEGELCILSRVNRNDTLKRIFVPIARSYDGSDWHRVEGRYVSYVSAQCGNSDADGTGYLTGDYLCEVEVPELKQGNVGYFLTKWEEGVATDRRKAARFLEKATWGARWDEITALETDVNSQGQKALALWVQEQQAMTPSSHRAFFRKRLNPRTVESYLYGIPGPKACEENARFRRFAFTYKDLELSRGSSAHVAGNTGLPMTPLKIQTVSVAGVNHYAIKFGDKIRTVLPSPLAYKDANNADVTLADGSYTICFLEEVVGDTYGNVTYDESLHFQLLVGDLCTSSYTNRGGIADGKGDGATSTEDVKVGGTLVRMYDKNACDAKCGNSTNVKLVTGGNPEVMIPDGFNKNTLSWIDISTLDPNTEIVNINAERTHDSSWLLRKNLTTCQDANGAEFPDPARLAYIDLMSTGHGKYNLDPPIFAKLPGNKWALHDFRTQFVENTPDNPLGDGGGTTMKRAARSGANNDGNPNTDLVTRCSNAQRNVFNEGHCRISYHPDACQSVPTSGSLINPDAAVEPVGKYLPAWAGPDGGGVIVCGSENEVAPIPTEDDHFDVTNRKVQSSAIDYHGQKKTVWYEVVLAAQDQLCQRLAFGLSKIFATSTDENSDSGNSETNIGVYDNHVNSCFSTYRDVMKKVSFNQEMSEQLTFKNSRSVARDWHRTGKFAFPDENYARENLQLHSIGLLKLNDDGTPVLDRFGKLVANYEQKHIFEGAKIWTSFSESNRRGNYEDLDWATTSYLDPLQIQDETDRDWFPKISTEGGYIGDKFPLCADLPERHFLKKGATFRLLGGSSTTLLMSHNDPLDWEGNQEIQRMSLHPGSPLYNKLCNPTNAPLPTSSLAAGTGIAAYDATFTAPFCQGKFSSCDSGVLLAGRSSFEPNYPNTVDTCTDGKNTNTTYSESVTRIKISSVKGNDLRGGDIVKIQATVTSRSKQDRVDFYYASDATSPQWVFITTALPQATSPPSGIEVSLPYTGFPDITYTLPKCIKPSGCKQAIRVVSRSSRDPNNPSTGLLQLSSAGQHKPNVNCPTGVYDDADDIVFEVLPSAKPKDTCSFQTLVTLDTNLECEHQECAVSTVRAVEVMPGVFYEYVPPACIHLPFYSDAVKVFASWSNSIAMCANKRVASARSTCCGAYTDRDLSMTTWGDVLSEYRGERLTFAGNQARCAAWGRTVCDPERIGSFAMWKGHCLHRQSCRDVNGHTQYLTNSAWQWTTAGCSIQVKVNPEGLIAVLHKPQNTNKKWGSQDFPDVQSHVNENLTVSYFNVHWDTTNVAIGKLEHPHVTDNACDGGTLAGEFCVCNTTVTTSAVFDALPTRADALSGLFVGAFDPTVMYDANKYTALVETTADEGVSVYKKSGEADYSEHTIFRIKNGYSNGFMFLKNVRSSVSVCNGSFFFRNSPTFFDITDPQLISAYHETDAYLDYVDRHSNTPPFVCKNLIKHFGYSNPSPHHVLDCSNAYKSGVFTWTNPSNSTDTIPFGGGKRGDLRAVSASILLSNDALSATLDSDPTFGGLKEPLHKLMQMMRSLEFSRSLSHRRTSTLVATYAQDALGQSPYGTPGTFSFFLPDYSPAGAHVESSLVSPESELLNLKYVIASQNAFYALIQNGLTACWGGLGPPWMKGSVQSCGKSGQASGYLRFVPKGDLSSSSNVVSQLSTLLTADRLDGASRSTIEAAYDDTLATDGEEAALKVAQALLVSTPVFHATNKAEPLSQDRPSTPATAEDEAEPYKAIIHLNLFGGMDSMNVLVPHPDGCQSLYDEYNATRGTDLYLTPDEFIKVNASNSDQPCSSFGINKHLGQGFVDLYNAGEVTFFANIGHLQKPVTAANFLAETKTQLFSHHTMKEESFKMDAFNQRDNTGVLGRMTDILGNSLSTSRISIDYGSTNLIGDPTIGLKVDVVGSRGPDQFYRNDVYGIKKAINELNNATSDTSSIHADLWSQSLVDSEDKSDNYASMLATVPESSHMPGSGLGKQLHMVLKMITLHGTRGIDRDTFALTMGGFDQHFNLKGELHLKLTEIGDAVKGFRDALVELGLWDQVTLVVSSEMGRTASPNTSFGTDHGWGGHSFVMGGKLDGGKVLGHHPETYSSEWKYNTGRGVWIPTTPFEAMWFGISQWFGLESNMALNYVLPNINNFGCRLYSGSDLYQGGTGVVPGCGGDSMTFSQEFFVSEPRHLNPDEQKSFCVRVSDAITFASIRCVILDQIIATREASLFQRSLNTGLDYTLGVIYEISSDSTGVASAISAVVNSNEFRTSTASVIQMEVSIESAQIETAPTQNPTMSPTAFPSKSPSKASTSSPSRSPTQNPTEIPTINPSKKPTKNPTYNPTSSPSTLPTSNPTNNPTSNPTNNPTTQPTLSPTTNQPTSSPIASPTKNPTNNPTLSPTAFPSKSPSKASTSSPSRSPTQNPTEIPTLNPSKNPTKNPTYNPTSSPSTLPTANPTNNPTSNPTNNPTTQPTLSPTTNQPTSSPIASPTKNPTNNPTSNPTTNTPTSNPTNPPTIQPTNILTSAPTALIGYCTDGSGRCLPTNMSQCACAASRRNLQVDSCRGLKNNECNAPLCSWAGGNGCIPASAPTTAQPTNVPTQNPTNAPMSSAPTPPPSTSKPTNAPTPNPSNAPTSKAPTSPPSHGPTNPPITNAPSTAPTNLPTQQQSTSNPTDNPTPNPTMPPTTPEVCGCSFTATPTAKPITSQPTGNPTNPPTTNPTNKPTANPTNPPTTNPTNQPTANPTNPPTTNPTNKPTTNPTNQPTRTPVKLTAIPTASPVTVPPTTPCITKDTECDQSTTCANCCSGSFYSGRKGVKFCS